MLIHKTYGACYPNLKPLIFNSTKITKILFYDTEQIHITIVKMHLTDIKRNSYIKLTFQDNANTINSKRKNFAQPQSHWPLLSYNGEHLGKKKKGERWGLEFDFGEKRKNEDSTDQQTKLLLCLFINTFVFNVGDLNWKSNIRASQRIKSTIETWGVSITYQVYVLLTSQTTNRVPFKRVTTCTLSEI